MSVAATSITISGISFVFFVIAVEKSEPIVASISLTKLSSLLTSLLSLVIVIPDVEMVMVYVAPEADNSLKMLSEDRAIIAALATAL